MQLSLIACLFAIWTAGLTSTLGAAEVTERFTLSDGRVLVGVFDPGTNAITTVGKITAHITLGTSTITNREPYVAADPVVGDMPAKPVSASTDRLSPFEQQIDQQIKMSQKQLDDLLAKSESLQREANQPYRPGPTVNYARGGGPANGAAVDPNEAKRQRAWNDEVKSNLAKAAAYRQQAEDVRQRLTELKRQQIDPVLRARGVAAVADAQKQAGLQPGAGPEDLYPALLARLEATKKTKQAADRDVAQAAQAVRDAFSLYAERAIRAYPIDFVPSDVAPRAGESTQEAKRWQADAQALNVLMGRLQAFRRADFLNALSLESASQMTPNAIARDSATMRELAVRDLATSLTAPNTAALLVAAGKPPFNFPPPPP